MKHDEGGLTGTLKQRQRRQAVYELRLQGYTIREIVRRSGHSTATVVDDLKCVDEALASELDHTRATAVLNERLAQLDALKSIAIEGFHEAEGCERVGYLKLVLKLIMSQVVILQNAGVIPKRLR